jgi:hypothetical protein
MILINADLLVIIDDMIFPVKRKQSITLLIHIDQLHQNGSIILIANKSPDEWAKVPDDQIPTPAISYRGYSDAKF